MRNLRALSQNSSRKSCGRVSLAAAVSKAKAIPDVPIGGEPHAPL